MRYGLLWVGVAAAVLAGLLSILAVTTGGWTLFMGAAAAWIAAAGLLSVGWRRGRSLPRSAQFDDESTGVVVDGDTVVEHPDELFRVMLRQNRAALLLRPQVAENLTQVQVAVARETLEDAMALVPDGDLLLRQPREAEEAGEEFPGVLLSVQAAMLDRYPVTNEQFLQFVQAGGYEESALWDREVLNGVFDFVDQTGQPGPRYWKNGKYAKGLAKHPVVGVNWYEANAYARWVGKRLPTDGEWVKAGCWPMPVPGAAPVQRKYPWGNDWHPSRANLWASGRGSTTPVDEYDEGVSVSGVYGLIGNVWEWTADFFGSWHGPGGADLLAAGMKSLRGGAFDTYFEKQATCQFQSGDLPLARKHNIGFRCAIGLCDLASEKQLSARSSGESAPAGNTVSP